LDAPSFEFIGCRNEGGAAFMAESWAKLTGEVGLCFVTRGPGATNASIGVHAAMQASTPMILFVGQVGLEHQGREAFQELNYEQVFGSIAKWTTEIRDTSRIPEIISRAWSIAISGRPGPVVVALPEDMLLQTADVTLPTETICRLKSAPDPGLVLQVAQQLETSRRPVLLVGGGGWSDGDRRSLKLTAQKLGLPVVTAFRFHDTFDNHNPLFLGEAGVGMTENTRRILQESDCVIALNIRFGEMTTDAFQLFNGNNQAQWIAHVHTSGDEFYKFVNPDCAVVSSPGVFLDHMLASLSQAALRFDQDWIATARLGFEQAQLARPQPGTVDMGRVTQHIQTQLTADAIVTNGAGNFAIWPNKFMRFGENQRLLAPQSGAMGYGVPAAIAAKIESPDRMVICFAGDGDFQMNCQELGTAMQSEACPIILIVNNGTYGTIRMHQERTYPERVSGTAIVNPDFVMLAKSYGFHGERVEKTDDFAAAFSRALASPTGAVLDLCVAQDAITPGQTISDIRKQAISNS
ncbi:MAG: thiamine pyrophosphate-dependent enzyme, partial [Planktomarina sp.]